MIRRWICIKQNFRYDYSKTHRWIDTNLF